MFEQFTDQEKLYYQKIIKERVLEVKFNQEDLEHVIDSIVNIINSDNKQSLSLSKSLKRLLGDKNIDLFKSDDFKLINKLSLEFLSKLATEVSNENYYLLVTKLEENQVHKKIINYIDKLRIDTHKEEMFIYFSLNIISILVSIFIFYNDYNRMEFIPIFTQIVVITTSLLLNKNNAIRSGVILALLNFSLIYPFKDMVTSYDFKLIGFIFIEYIIVGLIVALLPRLLNHLLKSFKTQYRLYVVTFIPSLIFTGLVTLGNVYYTNKINFNYQFNPLYKVLQAIFISIIVVQLIDVFKRNREIN